MVKKIDRYELEYLSVKSNCKNLQISCDNLKCAYLGELSFAKKPASIDRVVSKRVHYKRDVNFKDFISKINETLIFIGELKHHGENDMYVTDIDLANF